ncbi:hypothetical protein ACIBHY_33310 [Nonomuraea sp. NPDC050547]|uniref:hypothetical protein n=1 Tax=Nonomuraea sp. NPDC050547 TaxID=3364368 RepID=UPI00379FEE4D
MDHHLVPPVPSVGFRGADTRTRISNAERTERDAGMGRLRALEHHNDRAAWHETTLRSLLHQNTDQKARMGLSELLGELTADWGLGWSGIAHLVNVSVPAIRKWRLGGDVSPARLKALAQLVAFLQMLRDEHISDPASWLSLSMEDSVSLEEIRKTDIYASGGAIALLLYAKGYISQAELLSCSSAARYSKSQHTRVVRAPDGQLSIISTGVEDSSGRQEE